MPFGIKLTPNDVRESNMKLYADPITVNCRKVLAGFKLMGIPYERIHVDYFKSEQLNEDFIKINPNAALPALVDDDLVLWESNSLLQYAADKYGKSEFYPTDLKIRADINRWLLWEASAWFGSCYVYVVENCVKPVLDSSPDPKILEDQDPKFHKLAGILDNRLGQNEWIAGNGPTIADIACAAPMHLHGWQKLPLDQHANIRRWMTQNVEQLPAWKETHVGEGFTLS